MNAIEEPKFQRVCANCEESMEFIPHSEADIRHFYCPFCGYEEYPFWMPTHPDIGKLYVGVNGGYKEYPFWLPTHSEIDPDDDSSA